jgi:hypothetical protein
LSTLPYQKLLELSAVERVIRREKMVEFSDCLKHEKFQHQCNTNMNTNIDSYHAIPNEEEA